MLYFAVKGQAFQLRRNQSGARTAKVQTGAKGRGKTKTRARHRVQDVCTETGIEMGAGGHSQRGTFDKRSDCNDSLAHKDDREQAPRRPYARVVVLPRKLLNQRLDRLFHPLLNLSAQKKKMTKSLNFLERKSKTPSGEIPRSRRFVRSRQNGIARFSQNCKFVYSQEESRVDNLIKLFNQLEHWSWYIFHLNACIVFLICIIV